MLREIQERRLLIILDNCEQVIDVHRNKLRAGCLLGNFSAELANQCPLIRARLAALLSDWTRDIESAISEAQRTAAISTNAHPGRLAIFLLDSYEGAILRARVESSRRAFDAFMRVAFTQILV